ncbi:MAG TPA: response regulator [Opitutaceae bacterium]|nr:response regulator [Opitutaceae bacterium]
MTLSHAPLHFLVVDHHKDSRFLLVKCLQRKFPDAVIEEAEDGDAAIEIAQHPDLAAIVTHRTREYYGTELVEKFRAVNDRVPIVMVSGIERTIPALAAGADRFMLYDEWLRIGTLVKELLEQGRPPKIVHVEITPPERGKR